MRASAVALRQRVLAALDRGMSRQQVVATFGVSVATLKRWLVLQRTATPLSPKASPGRRRTIPVAQQAALWAQLEAHPDATLQQHAHLWNDTHAVHLRDRTLGRGMRRLGWTRKKRHWLPPSAMSRRGTTTGTE